MESSGQRLEWAICRFTRRADQCNAVLYIHLCYMVHVIMNEISFITLHYGEFLYIDC